MPRGIKGPDGFVCRYYRQRKYTRHSESKTYRLEFVYHEGTPYIEVNFKGHTAHDAINVWDYEESRPQFTTRKEIHERVREYMKDLSKEEMETFWEFRPTT